MPLFLHLRREPFEYGLLPLPNLMFTDGTSTLKGVREKLIQNSFTYTVNNNNHSSNNDDNNNDNNGEVSRSYSRRVNATGIAESLQISEDHARVVIDTLASVLPEHGQGGGVADPLIHASYVDVDSIGADVYDLILFLFIQTYKKLVPRTHKDAASVADVWPSTSAFDGIFASLSPLQVRQIVVHCLSLFIYPCPLQRCLWNHNCISSTVNHNSTFFWKLCIFVNLVTNMCLHIGNSSCSTPIHNFIFFLRFLAL